MFSQVQYFKIHSELLQFTGKNYFNNFLNIKFLFCFTLENSTNKRALIGLPGSECEDFPYLLTCFSAVSTPTHMLSI